ATKERAITMPRLRAIARRTHPWWRRRSRRSRQKACTRSSAPVGRRMLHFAKPPRRSRRRNPKAYLRWKWRLPPSTPSPKARALGFSASRTSPIPWAEWEKTSKRARRTEPVTRCKFSKQSCDQLRFEHTLSGSSKRTLRGQAATPPRQPIGDVLPPLRTTISTHLISTHLISPRLTPAHSSSTHLEDELAPEVARIARAVGVGGLGQPIELDLGRTDGAGRKQLGDAFEMPTGATDWGPQRRDVVAVGLGRLRA